MTIKTSTATQAQVQALLDQRREQGFDQPSEAVAEELARLLLGRGEDTIKTPGVMVAGQQPVREGGSVRRPLPLAGIQGDGHVQRKQRDASR